MASLQGLVGEFAMGFLQDELLPSCCSISFGVVQLSPNWVHNIGNDLCWLLIVAENVSLACSLLPVASGWYTQMSPNVSSRLSLQCLLPFWFGLLYLPYLACINPRKWHKQSVESHCHSSQSLILIVAFVSYGHHLVDYHEPFAISIQCDLCYIW